MFRKNSRSRIGGIALFVITIGSGCWHSQSDGPPPLANTAAPRARTPVLPDVNVAELGIWDNDGVFHPTFEVPLYAGSPFGWRINLPCAGGMVAVAEELHLPAPGDWPADPDMHVSRDLRSVTVRSPIACVSGWIEKQWSVSAGDPPGQWVIRVTADGFAPVTFRATFTRNVMTPAPGP